ncbi:MAG: hypothetical protein ACM37W_16770 [Actinomycetota bacterium]
MTLTSLLPLILSVIAAWISLTTDVRTLDGIPNALASISCILFLIWFMVLSPWVIKLSLMLLVVVLGQFYLRKLLKLG